MPILNHDLSIVIPFFNEEETVAAVLAEILETNPGAEVIAVNDGSVDGTAAILNQTAGVRTLHFVKNRGQSAAMYAGLKMATRPICALMDGDGQNDPADFPKLVATLQKGRADVICGYRLNRVDTASRRYASRFANKIRRMFLHDGVRDTGCSMKVFRREVVDHLVPFNGMHRYLPAIFLQAGLKIEEVPVNHRCRIAGSSKYTNWERGLRGIYDLIGVQWLLRRKVKWDTNENHQQ
jgi:dolichol-phosphate mannosyltransferase